MADDSIPQVPVLTPVTKPLSLMYVSFYLNIKPRDIKS
jgi:hypothetical protein